jgi:protein TonB
MSATLNTFPSLNQLNARSWTLALIILLHFGFFWALSSGVHMPAVFTERRTEIVPLPEIPKPVDKRVHTEPDVNPGPTIITNPLPTPLPPEKDVIQGEPVIHELPPPTRVEPQSGSGDVIEPSIDPSRGLSEPVYPAGEIRLNHSGTVILSVQVLENGRIGAVRIEESSGYPKLDAAATREAARWRLMPGTRDGVPVAMWKQIPITFRLNERQRI